MARFSSPLRHMFTAFCTVGAVAGMVWWAIRPIAWRHHLFNLLDRGFLSFTHYLGTNEPGWIVSVLASSTLTIILTVVLIWIIRGTAAMKQHWIDTAVIGLLAVVGQIIILYGPIYLRNLTSVVYDDHQGLVREIGEQRKENSGLIDERAKLKIQVEDLQRGKVKGTAARGLQQIAVPPETIHDALAEVRITCTLSNPSIMPLDKPLAIPGEDSYLEGAVGKSYLQSRAHSYKRAEEEGRAIAIENFKPPPKSDLIGRPVSALADYSALTIVDTSVSGGIFSECSFVEVTLRVNGRDVFRHGEPVSIKMDPKLGLKFAVKLEGMNLQ